MEEKVSVIFVTMDNRHFKKEIPLSTTGNDLKRIFKDTEGNSNIEESDLNFLLDGYSIDDDDTLNDYGITNGSAIDVIFTSGGG